MTNEQLAKALGLHVRTIERDRARGMPLPAEGEPLDRWAKRAKAWRRANRRLPGPRQSKEKLEEQKPNEALDRKRLAQAKKAELELEIATGKVHSAEKCEADDAARWGMVMDALRLAGTRIARRCGGMNPTPEMVQKVYDEEVREAIESMKRGALA